MAGHTIREEAGEIVLTHPEGSVALGVVKDGRRTVSVTMRDPSAFVSGSPCQTGYTPALIGWILDVKGPAYLCDEIRRDEDPAYVQERLEGEIGYFVDLRELDGKRILDFGCGGGASTFCLARLVKDAEIVGVELDATLLSIAEARKKYYQEEESQQKSQSTPGGPVLAVSAANPAIPPRPLQRLLKSRLFTFLLSSSGATLPDGIGTFDLIVLSAVYEHLLPEERKPVLRALWSVLRPGGLLFINQTPNRWFPVEQHTTGLPLLNYLPAPLAHYAARTWSRRGLAGDDWSTLLRKGIRGGSERGIVRQLAESGADDMEVKTPVRAGAEDGIDLWLHMSSSRWRIAKRGLWTVFKAFSGLTGIRLVPAYLVMAIGKRK